MKRIRELSEADFLRLFFALVSLAFLVAAVCMPDRNQMLWGLWQVISQPSKLSTNYFAVGGYAATFLNIGLVGLISLALFAVFHATPNNVSNLAFLLTLGFSAWGINILNIWPTVLGVMLYCLVRRVKFGSNVNAMLFSTGIAPLLTDLMIRYPYTEAVGFNAGGILIALVVGLAIGFFLPAGLAFSPQVHKGFDLYSAALPIGMMAFLLNGLLFKALGVTLPDGAEAAQLEVGSRLTVNLFCGILFGACVILALLLGCKPRDYGKLLTNPVYVSSFSGTYGNAVFLMNVGIFGLFILAYYNLVGVTFNGVTMGIIFCMLATANSGSHPGNVWPIIAGYVLVSVISQWLSQVAGGAFTQPINAQAICVGLCYANGLSPVAGKYGWPYGILAGALHYFLVTSVPALHGGFCLYNGGFTAALVCILLVPQLESFARTREEKLKTKA